MKKIVLSLLTFCVLLFSVASFPPALAHEECESGDIKFVGGWVNEPPVVDQLNGIELTVTRISSDEAIINAVAGLEIIVKKGTPTKTLNFAPTETEGVYDAPILPTQTGQYAVVIKGTVADQAVQCQIEIEDVGSASVLEFPPKSSNGNGGNNGNGTLPPEFLEQLRLVIQDLSSQVDQAMTASEEAGEAASAAAESANDLRLTADRAYIFGMVGVGVGVAGIVIGVVALSKSRDKT
ncbi:MAG: hypothetical protein ACREAZ_02400 [Nitrososphaera sp.]